MGNCWGTSLISDNHVHTASSGSRELKPHSRDTIFSSPSTQTISSLSGTTTNESYPSTPRPEGRILPSVNFKAFSFNDLKSATRKFCPDSVLGQGGFGSVFKGWIDEHGFTAAKPGTGMVIAVKKLNHESLQGHDERLAEVNYLGQLSHPNLVKLVGYCTEDDNLLLVYEFMPKGSLENHLFIRGSYYQPLSWAIRIKIALGAARGLEFLHDAKPKVIYRDFKTSNILLDSVEQIGRVCCSMWGPSHVDIVSLRPFAYNNVIYSIIIYTVTKNLTTYVLMDDFLSSWVCLR